jgi:hypothetical protein
VPQLAGHRVGRGDVAAARARPSRQRDEALSSLPSRSTPASASRGPGRYSARRPAEHTWRPVGQADRAMAVAPARASTAARPATTGASARPLALGVADAGGGCRSRSTRRQLAAGTPSRLRLPRRGPSASSCMACRRPCGPAATRTRSAPARVVRRAPTSSRSPSQAAVSVATRMRKRRRRG